MSMKTSSFDLRIIARPMKSPPLLIVLRPGDRTLAPKVLEIGKNLRFGLVSLARETPESCA